MKVKKICLALLGLWSVGAYGIEPPPVVDNDMRVHDVGTQLACDEVKNNLIKSEEVELTPDLAERFLPYAQLSKSAFLSGKETKAKVPGYKRLYQEKADVPEAIRAWFGEERVSFAHSKTGFMAVAFIAEDPNEKCIVLAFTGSDTRLLKSRTWKNFTSVFQQSASGIPGPFWDGLTFAREIKNQYPGYSFEVTGTSLGGGVAQFVGLFLDADTYVFNAVGLGYGSRKYLREEVHHSLDDIAMARVHNINLDGEILTTYGSLIVGNRVGNNYLLPCADQSLWAWGRHQIGAVIDSLKAFPENRLQKIYDAVEFEEGQLQLNPSDGLVLLKDLRNALHVAHCTLPEDPSVPEKLDLLRYSIYLGLDENMQCEIARKLLDNADTFSSENLLDMVAKIRDGVMDALRTVAIPMSMDDRSTRMWYHEQLAKIDEEVRTNKDLNKRERAIVAFKLRFDAKYRARAMMIDQDKAAKLPPAQTLCELVFHAHMKDKWGKEVWSYIEASAQRSNKEVDKACQ